MNPSVIVRWRRAAALSAVAGIMTAGLVAGCGSGEAPPGTGGNQAAENEEAADLLPNEIKDAGVVTVASTFGYPPEQFYEADGSTPTGFSVELGYALGEKLGVEFRFKNVSFDAILPGIDANRFDIAISSMSVTPERSAQVNFVTYLDAGGSVLVSGDNPNDIQGIEDLCGMTVSNTTGSIHTDYMNEYSKSHCVAKGEDPIEVMSFSDAAAPNQAVSTGRADACFRDFTANAYLADNSDGEFEVVGGIVKNDPYGIAVSKEDTELAQAIKVAMDDLIESGEYHEIMKKWNVEEAELDQAELIKATG